VTEQIYQSTFDLNGRDLYLAPPIRVNDPIPGQRLNRGLFSSLTPEWPTPPGVFDALDSTYHFTLDACATPENAKCSRYFTSEQDALRQEWTGSVWLNPPYGREIGLWLKKAVDSSKRGATVVCLVPSRTDTDWWHRWCMQGNIFFVRGRLRFGDADNSAPFPSAIVVFEPAGTPTLESDPARILEGTLTES
jgi:phage N-6-adenine-methyltransferase